MSSDSADTIKEFLVSIGYKIDEASGKKFTSSIDAATKDVFKLGTVIVGTLAIADTFVTKLAERFDKLYFASKRTGSTISEMNAFSYAVTQLGGSAEGAASAMEALASFRLKYGGAADQALINFGVKPEDVKDSAKSLIELGDSWRNLRKITGSDAQGLAQANFLGVDERTYRAITDGTLDKLYNDRQEKNRSYGLDLDKLAEDNRQFNQSLADTENAWSLVASQLESHLLPAMKQFNEWSENIARSLPKTLDNLGDWLFTQQNKSKLETEKDIITRTGDFISQFGAGIIGTFYKGISALNGTSSTDEFGLDYSEDRQADTEWRKRNAAIDAAIPKEPIAIDSSQPRGVRNNNPGNIRNWQGIPQSDGYAVFPSVEAGLSAMASNLLTYGKRGWDSIDEIVKHWAPAKDGNNVPAYEAALAKMTGYGVNDKLDLRNPAVLENIMKAMINQENGKNPYNANLIDQAARARLGNSNQINNITVNAPNSNGDQLAKKIAYHVSDAGSRIIRNMQSAVT